MGSCLGSMADRKHGDQEGLDKRGNASHAQGKEPMIEMGESSAAAATREKETPNLKMFSIKELKRITMNFSKNLLIQGRGKGYFGTVYKGWVEGSSFKPSKAGVGMPVAIKIFGSEICGRNEWQCVVDFLDKFSHPNLVKLYGYCWDKSHLLLVHEYMQKGSLENHLFKKGIAPLPWDIRIKIAIGAAKGLAFLHACENPVIYTDFNSSNILLDGEYNAKLSNYELAMVGSMKSKSHTSRSMGCGYIAPEYLDTGHRSIQVDVYGFGVVLLEILIGSIASDDNRPLGNCKLVDYVKPSLNDRTMLKKKMDPRLGDRYPTRAAFKIAQLVLKCLEVRSKIRPSMKEVLNTLEEANEIN